METSSEAVAENFQLPPVSESLSLPGNDLSLIFTILAIFACFVVILQRFSSLEFLSLEWQWPRFFDSWFISPEVRQQEAERLRVLTQVKTDIERRRKRKTEELKRRVQELMEERETLLEQQISEQEEQQVQLLGLLVKKNFEEEQRIKAEQALHEKSHDLELMEKMIHDTRRKMVELDVKEAQIKRRESELKKRELELEAKNSRAIAIKEQQIQSLFSPNDKRDIEELVKEFGDCQKDVVTNGSKKHNQQAKKKV